MNHEDLNKRMFESAIGYTDDIFECYSKVEVVRVDLGYGKERSSDVSVDDLRVDLSHLRSNRRTKPSIFRGMVGYIIKSEYTEEKGPHAHGIFFYDGNKTCKGGYKGTQIGEYWCDVITGGDGVYHNCNMNIGEYKMCGIGMVDYSDEVKRAILKDKVISYICKTEQDIVAIKQSGRERALTRGISPKKKSNAGRPRGKGQSVGGEPE